MSEPALCTLCGADWRSGAFTASCTECGGGAMERSCLACNGACGAISYRCVHDSQDERVGVWTISCNLRKR